MSIYKKSKGPGEPGKGFTTDKYENSVRYTREDFDKGRVPANESYALGHLKRNPNLQYVTTATTIDASGNKWPGMIVGDSSGDKSNISLGTDPMGKTAMYDQVGQMPATEAPIFGTPKKSIKYKK